jgi:hypothetical protein
MAKTTVLRAVNETDTGQIDYPPSQVSVHTAPAPMRSYNNGLVRNWNRLPSSSDMDILPHEYRRYMGDVSGATNMQLNNGLSRGIMAGKRINYAGAGYMYGVVPRIPGQTRGDVAGFHPRGPSPLNYDVMWEAGPGSQPANPAGPGRIAAPIFFNPMSG